MTDSAIAFGVFGGDMAVLATDVVNGVHTLKVTTATPSDGIAIEGFGAAKYIIGTVKSDGIHMLCATTSAPNSAIALSGAGGNKLLIATVESGGVHVVAVTSNAGIGGIAIASFGSDILTLSTVQSAGVHTLAITTAPNGGFTTANFAAGKSVISAAKSGNVYSVALSGLQDPEAAAYFAAAGITSAAAKTLINGFFVSVKSYFGIAALSEVFDQIILAANESKAAVVVDLCGNINATLVNNPGQSPWRYIENANTAQYIDLNFVPTTGIRFNGAHHSFGFYSVMPVSGVSANQYGAINSSFQGYQLWGNDGSGTAFFGDSNSVAVLGAVSPSPQNGLYAISRLTAANWSAFFNGTKLGTQSGASNVSINWSMFGLGRNYNGTDFGNGYANPVRQAFYFEGRGLSDAEMSVFSTFVNTLITGLAAL